MSKHFFFIINPTSEKKSSELKRIIINFFKDLDERFTIFVSENFKHVRELTIKAVELKANAVIACGGDGTVNMVGQILVGTDIQLGIIPIGSGNGVANNMGISNNYEQALKKIILGNILKIDVGRIDDYFFFSNVGFGLEAEFIRHYKLRNSHGFLSYFFSFFKSLNSYKPSKFKIVQKLKDFIINFLGNDSEVKILKNIKYNPRDKIKFEYSKEILVSLLQNIFDNIQL